MSNHRAKVMFIVIGIAVFAMIVAGCKPAVAPPAEPVVLDLVFGTEPPTGDPALAEDTTSVYLTAQIFMGLTDLNEETAKPEPWLATSWDVSEDGLVYTFHMRNDVKWVHYNAEADKVEEVGTVKAQDVEYGTKRTLDPATGSPYSYVAYIIKGAEEYNAADPEEVGAEGMQALRDAVGVKAIDDYTVEFTLTHSAAYFPQIASMWITKPQPQATIEEFGEKWAEAENVVSNGPYVLKEWEHEAKLVLIKNPLWYDADKIQIDVINGPIVGEASTAMAMYEAGDIDVVSGDPGWGIPLPDMDRVKSDPVLSKEFSQVPMACTYYYGFVQKEGSPFLDVLVRKAFAAAIDRKALIENVLKGDQIPAHSFVCPGMFGNAVDDATIAPYLLDIEDGLAQAQDLLAEAGYPNCEGMPPITLMHNTSEAHALIAQAIAAMWKENLGCDVEVTNQEWKVFLDTLKPYSPDEEKPEIYRLGWCMDYPDANNWLNEVFNSESPENYAKFHNEEFDSTVEEAEVEQDPDKRVELYDRAEHILIDENMAIAPIYYYVRNNLHKAYVTNHPYGMAGGAVNIYKWTIDWEAKKEAKGL